MTRGLLSATLCAAFCMGCGGGAEQDTFAVRDSAGVAIVVSSDSSWSGADRWTLDAEPLLEIGAADGAGPEVFSNIRVLQRLPSGVIVVADGRAAEVRYFAPDGSHLRTAGGRGGGAGEFQDIAAVSMRLTGGAAWLYDNRRHRVVAFDSLGHLAHELQPAAWRDTRFIPRGSATDTLFVGEIDRTRGVQSPGALSLVQNPVVTFDASGNPVDTIGHVPAPLRGTGPAGQSRPVVVVPRQLFGFSSTGVWHSLPFQYELTHYRASGGVDRIVRLQKPVAVLSNQQQRDLRSQVAASLQMPGLPPDMQANIQWSIDNMVVRDSLPAFRNLHVDDEGNLWLEEYADPTPPLGPGWSANPPASGHYTVLDTEGRWLGTVAIPDRFTPHHIGRDFMLGVWKDDFDVEFVRIYRLNRP